MRGRCDTLARDSPGPHERNRSRNPYPCAKIGRDPFSPLTRRNGPHPYANTHRPSHTKAPTVSGAAQLRDSAVSCSCVIRRSFIPFLSPASAALGLDYLERSPVAANRSSSNPNRRAPLASCSSSKVLGHRPLSSTSSRTGRRRSRGEKCERKAQRCRREAEEQDLKWHGGVRPPPSAPPGSSSRRRPSTCTGTRRPSRHREPAGAAAAVLAA